MDAAYLRIIHKLEAENNERAWTQPIHGKSRWVLRSDATPYSYRTIYKNEVVFDIGDKVGWDECRKDTILLWGRLERAGVPYWGALSGGKGTHTHVFVSDTEYRWPFAVWATGARSLLGQSIEYDRLLVSPSEGGRQVREFGVQHFKTGRKKTMWRAAYDDLPEKQDDAYKMAQGWHPYPTVYENAGQPPGANLFELRRALCGPCPVSLSCLDSRDYCDECVVNR